MSYTYTLPSARAVYTAPDSTYRPPRRHVRDTGGAERVPLHRPCQTAEPVVIRAKEDMPSVAQRVAKRATVAAPKRQAKGGTPGNTGRGVRLLPTTAAGKVLIALKLLGSAQGRDVIAMAGLEREQGRQALKKLRRAGYVTSDGYKAPWVITESGRAA